jgi:F-type H+-transporting ATPase subunit delta
VAKKQIVLDEISRRYAKAYLEAVDESKVLSKAEKDIATLQSLIDSSEEFRSFLKNPVPKLSEQNDVIDAFAQKLKLTNLTKNFLYVVADGGRLSRMNAILYAIAQGIDLRNGIITARVGTAKELDTKQQDALVKNLAKVTGKNIKLDIDVDPSLLGGMVVQVGSSMIDDSVKTKLQRLQREMKGAA